MSESDKTHFFPKGKYHSQLRSGPDLDKYGGEYRGFYPDGNVWRPKSSHYLGRVGSHPHRGVDIYAPYATHPLETPVCAVVDGTLFCRDGLTEPQELGNRAELKFGDNFDKIFSYGHLSRFEGRDGRKVKAGEIIGYSGCSGNADTAGECSECGVCNINSGHVHLSVRGPANMDRNPLSHCNLRLRFGIGDSLLDEQKCSDWIHPETGMGLKEKWKPSPPKAAKLLGSSELNWRRIKGKRAPLSEPFTMLEFDSTQELRATQQFFAKSVKRLEELAVMPSPTSPDDKALKQLLERIRNYAVNELTSKGKDRLNELRRSIGETDGEVFGLALTEEPTQVPGWVLRHLAVLAQMGWIVFGGSALDRLADNQEWKDDKPTYNLLPQIGNGGAHKDMRAFHLPQCGAGVGGVAYLSASDTARNALHFTKLDQNLGEGARSYWIASISFGAGSLMHATISELMAYPAYGKAIADQKQDEAIASYVNAAADAASKLLEVHTLAHTHQVALSNELGSSANAVVRRRRVLKLIRDKIIETATAFADCNAVVGEEMVEALLLRMVQTNTKLFEDLMGISSKPEGQLPIGPAFYTLKTMEA